MRERDAQDDTRRKKEDMKYEGDGVEAQEDIHILESAKATSQARHPPSRPRTASPPGVFACDMIIIKQSQPFRHANQQPLLASRRASPSVRLNYTAPNEGIILMVRCAQRRPLTPTSPPASLPHDPARTHTHTHEDPHARQHRHTCTDGHVL